MKINVELENGVKLLFPTPIFHRVWSETDEINRRLREIVLEKEREEGGVKVSNAGNAWQSTPELMNWQYPEIEQLRAWIETGVLELIHVTNGLRENEFNAAVNLWAWANVTRRGGFNRSHSHPQSHWSGCYYVDVGISDPDAEDSGHFEFLDPRTGVEMMHMPHNPFGSSILFQPEPGMMIIFPSWVRHAVLPFAGEGERITIAFNMAFNDFQASA